MKYLFTAPALTKPTFETLQEYSIKRFNKIEKLLKDIRSSELNLKISVTKVKHTFCIVVEIYMGNISKPIIVKEKDNDLRRIIDKASAQLKNEIIKNKKKRFDLSRLRKHSKKTFNNYS